MRWSFPLTPATSPAGLRATEGYYDVAAHRPLTVVVYRDVYFEPINPIGPRFDAWYRLVDTQPASIGTLSIYRRR